MAAKISFTNPKHGSQVFLTFAEMKELDELCDIKIETSVDEISAHKVVLSACSPYFREAFKDIDADDETLAIPEEHNSKVVAEIINYFYTGRLEFDAKLLPEMLASAVFLQTQDILDRIEDHVVRQLTVENCLDYHSKAEEYNMKDLKTTIVRFINWHFMEVVVLEEWLELSARKVSSLVCNDVLNIEKEEDVYEALWKWFKYDESSRKCECQELFSHVRFFQLDPTFITERVIPDLAKGIEVCKDEIKQAIIYQSSDKKKRQEMDMMLKHRYPSKIIFMFDSKASIVEKYDPITVDCVQERRLMAGLEMSADQGYKSAVVVDNNLFVVSASKVEKFNNLNLSWEKVGKGVNIQESAICADEDCFYVIGGRDQPTAVKCFNMLSLSWSQLPNMPEGRRSAGAVASNGRVYVMGGYGPNGPLSSSYRFSTRSNKWKGLVKMNSERFRFSALIIRKQIFVIGGRNNAETLNTIETFDLESSEEKWEEFEYDMLKKRNEFGAVLFNGQLWCMGGRGENSMERFDFCTNSWELVGKLGQVRYGMSCVLLSLF